MLLRDYVHLLQKFYMQSIGEYELCQRLFDFVIEPANLLNANGDILTINKSRVSQIMNGTAGINTQIRDHIYDQSVIDQLVSNFEKEIVIELNPEREDLCYRMMQYIEKDNISPSRKAEFQMLAHEQTICPFLAKAFVYVVVENTNNPMDQDSHSPVLSGEPELTIKGITDNRKLSDTAVMKSFAKRLGMNRDSLIQRIRELYKKAADIHLEVKKEYIDSTRIGLLLRESLYEQYTVNEEKQKIINTVAERLHIELPADFYEFGGLKKDPVGGYSSLMIPVSKLIGSSEEKRKAEIIDEIEDAINQYIEVIPFIEAFQNVQYIELAAQNAGTGYDQDVRITLTIEKSALLTAEEISLFDGKSIQYLINKCDHEKQFGISKGREYLEYHESENPKIQYAKAPKMVFPYLDTEATNYIKEIQNILGYFYIEDTTDYFAIEVTIDKINQYTAVAFPTIILLKNPINEIRYSIKSKMMNAVVEGRIVIE